MCVAHRFEKFLRANVLQLQRKSPDWRTASANSVGYFQSRKHPKLVTFSFGEQSSRTPFKKAAVIMGKHGTMLLGGHRGMGENLATTGADGKLGVYPAFRENTIHSFKEAVNCGVGFVEFDVQVTRDNIPVIWHDDDVVLGPADHPRRPQVKDLTLAELRAICGSGRNGSSSPIVVNGSCYAKSKSAENGGEGNPASGTSSSNNGIDAVCVSDGDSEGQGGDSGERSGSMLLRRFRDRVTRQWAPRYERWTCAEDDGIPTLESVFQALPPEVGFDIEIKMTTGDDVVHTPTEEVDRMLGAILPVVERCAGVTAQTAQKGTKGSVSPLASPLLLSFTTDFVVTPTSATSGATPSEDPSSGDGGACRRRIMFSSFDPDVCLELTRRQAVHPVYYLSGCGLYEHADARRTSIPAALNFAREAGMRGIVLPASVLLKNMDMVASANSNHLELMTYGLENNDLDCLQAQADAGVTAAIVDEVAGVTAALGPGGGKGVASGGAAGGAAKDEERQEGAKGE